MSSPLRKLRRNVGGRHHTVPLHPSASFENEFKMSQVLLEFAEPLLEEAVDEADFKTMIGLAVVFWDLALLPEEEQSEALREIARDLARDAQSDAKMVGYFEMLGEVLLLRKKTLFPDIKRAITGHEFVGEGESVQLLVTSTPA